jgi:hypothetical protein
MRLLKLQSDGQISLTEDLHDNITQYAIRSHTLGADDEELTFKDVLDGTGIRKAQKVRFCGEQATCDNLDHFWVDSCCTIQTHYQWWYLMKRVVYATNNNRSSHPILSAKLRYIHIFLLRYSFILVYLFYSLLYYNNKLNYTTKAKIRPLLE